jgi:ribosomal-protein-alanine N-acetyltransferase
MQTLRIALAQIEQTADFEANGERILDALAQAARAGVQIICLPETQTAGYRVDITPADAPVQVEKLAAFHDTVAGICREHGLACILGTETPPAGDLHGGKPYNSAMVISEAGEVLGIHHKTKLTPLDAVAYTPGTDIETWSLFGVTVGVVICFEGFRFAETTAECVRQGAQIVFHPQNNTTRPNDWKIPIHHAMIRTRAAENTIWFASCNCVHVPHQNCRTQIIAPNGEIHAECDMKQPHLLVSDIDVDLATRAMFNFDTNGCADMLFADTVKPGEYAPDANAPQSGDSL